MATTKKRSKKKVTVTSVVSVAERRDKNLEVSKIIVSVNGYQSNPVEWWGLSGKSYRFVFDPAIKRHAIQYNSIEEYEEVREDLIHNANGQMIGTTGFQVHVVTVAQHEKNEKARRDAKIALEKKNEAIRKAQEKVQEEVNEAEKQLEEAREKLGAVKLKSTSLNIE